MRPGMMIIVLATTVLYLVIDPVIGDHRQQVGLMALGMAVDHLQAIGLALAVLVAIALNWTGSSRQHSLRQR